MGKKVKIGKQRRDKAYWAAKEIGYRSRASFKLIQLNRKWEFLQKSSVCIDLCAAPGSWMQVCREHMPMSSLVVGVDLAPIKPIAGCINLQDDITTDKCKADLKKELKTAKADLVLHDGAPNVGKNWIHDAYQQNLLTLHAFKLATCFLSKGGWFVTKIFRSKDYQSLIWVFGQFFKKVHATKPPASRNESAEIFVVCQNYLAPDTIDPKFLDAKHVFSDIVAENKKLTTEIMNPEKAKKKPTSVGYEDGRTLLFKEAKASVFIMGDDQIKILNDCNRIILDTPRILAHPKTTKEIKECVKDLKVLGIRDLRSLKKWQDSLRKEFEAEDALNPPVVEEAGPAVEKTQEEIEDGELEEIDKKISELKDEERRAARRKRKKELKERQKRIERLNLKMIIPGDEGPTASEEGLFKISALKSSNDLKEVLDNRTGDVDYDSEDEEKVKKMKFARFDREKGTMDEDGLWYEEHELSDDEGADAEDDEDEEAEEESEDGEEDEQKDSDEEDQESKNPLLKSLSDAADEPRKTEKAERWFKKIGGMDSDSDLEEAELERAVTSVKKRGASFKQKQDEQKIESGYTSGSDDEDQESSPTKAAVDSDSDTDSDDSSSEDEEKSKTEDGDFEIVPKEKIKKRKQLSAEELAIGEEMIKSKKRKRDLMDSGWNRFMSDDTGLPDWFVKEEEMHMKKQIELDPETVQKYREKEKEMNVKTIKKVVEAKARRKRRVAKQMDKAKKKATALLDNADIGSREKANEIRKMYSAAAASGKKKEVKYVVAKKHQAGKRASRPAGTKGPFKQVDPRMKKDNTEKRGNATGKRAQKRRLKGKQAKPTKQFNTNR